MSRLASWLFPDVEEARRSALARINAIKARSDIIDAQYAKLMSVARVVAPLIEAAEMQGHHPSSMRLELTEDDCKEIDAANLEMFRLGHHDHFEPVGGGYTLYGVRIIRGTQRRVVFPTNGAPADPTKVRTPE